MQDVESIDWSKAPHWANFYVKGRIPGYASWYQFKPYISINNCWTSDRGCVCSSKFLLLNCDWKESLQERK